MATKTKDKPLDSSTKSIYRKWLLWLWVLFFLGMLCFTAFLFLLSRQDLPSFEDLENPKVELATTVYAQKGEILGRYFNENRVPIRFRDLNPHLVNALISTEDKRYYSHSGIDFPALARVVAKTLMMGRESSGGGSTISQQLAKLLYTDRPARNKFERAIQKFKEWITAVRLEKSYTKEEIISMYLNEFDFINGAHGIQSAAETYFGKNQENLNIEESALLIGMLKNPARYNPNRFKGHAQNRRNTVLSLMRKAKHFDRVTADSLQALEVDMTSFKRSTHVDGLAPYFRSELAKDLRRLLEGEAYRKPDGSKYNIYRDGLKVFSTIDYKMQALAEEVMLDHMKTIQKRFFGEWRRMNPWTYDDEHIEVELKKDAFDRMIKECERYQEMLNKKFGSSIDALEKKNEFTLRPVDLNRLLKIDKDKNELTRLLAKRLIGKKLAARYNKIIKSQEWKNIVSEWEPFEKEVQEVFNEKVPMKIFDYVDNFERDTIMTPSDSLKYHRMHLQTGMLAIDPATGHVKVWIGGINHKNFKYDHIRTDRQVGSTFKPFVYASAIFFKGISPCFKVEDVPYTITPGEGNFWLDKPWTPKNSDGKYERTAIPLYDCLKRSKNSASVFLMKQLGDTKPIRGLIHNMGLDSSRVRSDGEFRIPAQPSICLGSADLTVWEMTGAYTTFANNGVYNEPTTILRIEDKNGKVIYRSTPKEHVVLDPKRNFVMVDMMKYATKGVYGFDGVKSDYGGKTGTTNDHTDGWFMGITPDLVVGTWVGGEDKWIRFRSFMNGQGSRMARPFFSTFLKRLEKSKDIDYDFTKTFERPAKELGIEIDCEEYELLNPTTENQEDQKDFFEEEFEDDL
jgi:penicillin-binding protein 1A